MVVFPGETRTYAGLAGLRQAWIDWLEPWATYRIGIDELVDLGDRVVVLDRDHGRRGDMDQDVELLGATILTFTATSASRQPAPARDSDPRAPCPGRHESNQDEHLNAMASAACP